MVVNMLNHVRNGTAPEITEVSEEDRNTQWNVVTKLDGTSRHIPQTDTKQKKS